MSLRPKIPKSKGFPLWDGMETRPAMQGGTLRYFSVILCLIVVVLTKTVPAKAFNDDSSDDSQPGNLIRTQCDDGRTIVDTPRLRYSCSGDKAYIDRIRGYLFKNGKQVSDEPILDFKLSRSGNLFYRSQIGNFLYDEQGPLPSSRSGVVAYWVSSSGDVLYFTQNRRLYKNGRRQANGSSIIPLIRSNTIAPPPFQAVNQNPKFSRNGKAVYINDNQTLYIDGKKITGTTIQVSSFKVDSEGNVYYLDTQSRLYKNNKKIYSGRFKIIQFEINFQGKLAYRVNAINNNLFFDGKRMSAGANKIIGFQFDPDGTILYEDALGRLWSQGKRIVY